MAEDKNSFVMYANQKVYFEQLKDDEAGRLVKHLFRYINDEDPEAPDRLTELMFAPIKQQLKVDLAKWGQTKAGYSDAGKESAKAKKLSKTQLYVLRFYKESEEFIMLGIIDKKNSVWNKPPYKYDIIYQYFPKTNEIPPIQALVEIGIIFKHYKYEPSLVFNGNQNCYQLYCLDEVIEFLTFCNDVEKRLTFLTVNDNVNVNVIVNAYVNKNTGSAGAVSSSKAFNTTVPKEIAVPFQKWLEMRKVKKAPATDYAIELALKELEKLSADPKIQIQIINRSILKSWTDFYPLPTNNSYDQGKQTAHGNQGNSPTAGRSLVKKISKPQYKNIVLTKEEAAEALREAREKKHYVIKEKEYWDKVSSEPQYAVYTAQDLYKVIRMRAKSLGFEFIFDEDNKHVIELLCYYFTGDKKFEEFKDETNENYSLNKGIMLFGNVGCGKTDTMRLFSSNQITSYQVINSNTIASLYSEAGEEGLKRYKSILHNATNEFGHKEYALCIDDIGIESNRKYYGDECDTIASIILARYDAIHYLRAKTHITTNLDGTDLVNRYGTRVSSRINQMFNVIAFPETAKDRRK